MSYNVVFFYIKYFSEKFIFETLDNKKNKIPHKVCEKPSIETFLKKIAKIQVFMENQCRIMLYFSISRIFYKISFLKLWTIKKIIKKWTK